jgi:hypothetical protein
MVHDHDGNILAVQWTLPDGKMFIQISEQDALAFLDGTQSLIDHMVLFDADKPSFGPRVTSDVPVHLDTFSLINMKYHHDISMKLQKNHLIIKTTLPHRHLFPIFVTLKDDPSWLIATIMKKDLIPTKDGSIKLQVHDPRHCDFFIQLTQSNVENKS